MYRQHALLKVAASLVLYQQTALLIIISNGYSHFHSNKEKETVVREENTLSMSLRIYIFTYFETSKANKCWSHPHDKPHWFQFCISIVQGVSLNSIHEGSH